MDPRLARRIAIVALGLGIVGDVLFDRQGYGINVPIAVAIAVVAAPLVRPRGARIDRLDWWLPPIAILAAAGVALRTDPPIVALDLGLAAAATLAWMVAASGEVVTRRSVDVVVALAVWAGAWLGIGGVVVLGRAGADGAMLEAGRSTRWLLPLVRGLLLATPVVLVLGALLAAADDAFGQLLGRLVEWPFDLSDLALRSVIVVGLAWLAAGALSIATGTMPFKPSDGLRSALQPRSLGAAAQAGRGWLVLPGATEALVVLVAVDVLFATFVLVQLGYLFGGLATVLGTGRTFSDYAREGYFELVAVVVIAGGLIVVAEAAGHRSRAFLGAVFGLIALTFTILASAAVRLALYLQIYGWTELRFYVGASMAWLALGGAILAVLIARDRIRWLAHGLAFGAIGVTLVVTAIGPQAFVTRQNLDRILDPSLVPPQGRASLDVEYLAELGDDAIPKVVAAWPGLDSASKQVLDPILRERRTELASDPTTTGWPAWNLAREQARSALRSLLGP